MTLPSGYVVNGVTYHNQPEYVAALQNEIARQNGGKTLEASVIYSWLSHEGQAPANATDTNILNIWSGGKSGSGLEVGKKAANNLYATPETGIQATAYLILHGPYAGIRATLAAPGKGDPIAQATAIQTSPWAASHYGGALVGSVRKAVANGYKLPGTTTTTPGGNVETGGSLPPVTGTVPPGSGSTDVTPTLPPGTLAAFLGHDGTLSLADLPAIAAAIALATTKVPGWPGGGEKEGDVHNWLVDFVGHKYSTIPLNVTDPGKTFQTGTGDTNTGSTRASPDPLTQAVNGLTANFEGIAKVTGFFLDPENWVYILALMIGVPMAGYGIIRLSH